MLDEHAAAILALQIVLTDKGLMTADEFERARVRAIAILDQVAAEHREAVAEAIASVLGF